MPVFVGGSAPRRTLRRNFRTPSSPTTDAHGTALWRHTTPEGRLPPQCPSLHHCPSASVTGTRTSRLLPAAHQEDGNSARCQQADADQRGRDHGRARVGEILGLLLNGLVGLRGGCRGSRL